LDDTEKHEKLENVENPKIEQFKKPKRCDLSYVHDGLGNFEQKNEVHV